MNHERTLLNHERTLLNHERTLFVSRGPRASLIIFLLPQRIRDTYTVHPRTTSTRTASPPTPRDAVACPGAPRLRAGPAGVRRARRGFRRAADRLDRDGGGGRRRQLARPDRLRRRRPRVQNRQVRGDNRPVRGLPERRRSERHVRRLRPRDGGQPQLRGHEPHRRGGELRVRALWPRGRGAAGRGERRRPARELHQLGARRALGQLDGELGRFLDLDRSKQRNEFQTANRNPIDESKVKPTNHSPTTHLFSLTSSLLSSSSLFKMERPTASRRARRAPRRPRTARTRSTARPPASWLA